MDGLPDFWVLRPNAAPHKKGRFFCHCSINRARWKGLKTAGRRFFCKRCPAAFAPFCFWGFFFSGGKGCNFFYCLFCGLYLPSLPAFKFLNYSFDALRPRRAPTFWPAESRQRLAKEGCAPFGIPPGGRAGAAFGHNSREGSDGTPSRFAAGASAQICEGVARKAISDAVPCAFAHDRRLPLWGTRGPGGEAPNRRA